MDPRCLLIVESGGDPQKAEWDALCVTVSPTKVRTIIVGQQSEKKHVALPDGDALPAWESATTNTKAAPAPPAPQSPASGVAAHTRPARRRGSGTCTDATTLHPHRGQLIGGAQADNGATITV